MRLTLHRRTRKLCLDRQGRRIWEAVEQIVHIKPEQLAIIICDMWDRHWCRGASERVDQMAPRVNEVIGVVRDKGALIIHAPSETMDYYEGSPARQRALRAAPVQMPEDSLHEDPPLPIDDSDGGCDSRDNPGGIDQPLWTRQHPAILIDRDRDIISAEGPEIYNVLYERGIRTVVIMGVHTNMCILNRSFGIKQLVRWGLDVMLCRDLTDSMYNPSSPPYVDHNTGTDLVIAFIESHWCPTIPSSDLNG
jgi:nicotinamidase-related amidase